MFARFVRTVALLLFAGQAIIAQAHLHAGGRWAGAAVSAQTSVRSTPAQPRRDGPLDCPVCREVAHAGQYLSPGPVVVHAPARVTAWRAVTVLPVLGIGSHSHTWRSRAPPASQLS